MRKDDFMKLELCIGGKVVVIEGDFTVVIRDDVPASPLHVVPDDDFFKPDVPSVVNDELFRKLAGLRKEIAANKGVPPYVVFHDKTLREMIQKMPDDMAALGTIPGVGSSKLEKYGEMFLSVLKGA